MNSGEQRQEGSNRALAEEIEKNSRLLLEDEELDPLEDEPGPSHESRDLRYTIRKNSGRTFARKAAVDRTYQVHIHEYYRGQRLRDICQGLHRMFEDILDQARGDLAGNDLGRVVIHHDGLQDSIVVPLQPWDRLNLDVVMETSRKY